MVGAIASGQSAWNKMAIPTDQSLLQHLKVRKIKESINHTLHITSLVRVHGEGFVFDVRSGIEV